MDPEGPDGVFILDTVVPEIVTLSEARRLGLKHYFTGIPCTHGHVSKRSVNGRSCMECARITRREFVRANPEIERQRQKAYIAANREISRAQAARDRARNKDRRNETTRIWRSRNVPKQNQYSAKRYAAKLTNTPEVRGDLLPAFQSELLAIYAEARTLTELTGVEYHVDHIFPLSKGGAHAPWNLRVLLGFDNISKKDKWPKGEPTHVMWQGEIVSRLVGSKGDF